MKYRTGPQQLRPCVVLLSEADSARVKRLIVREGSIARARDLLGIGDSTMAAARDCGRMLRDTRERLLEALAREEGRA